MVGPTKRLIQKQGREYEVYNAADSGGDRTTPNYGLDGNPDNTLIGVLERRSRAPSTVTDSSGDDIESTLELRAVFDSSETTIVEAAEDDYPTKLVHPDGPVYRVLAKFPEDSGVTVLTLERD